MIWLLLAVACGGGDSSPVPTDASGQTQATAAAGSPDDTAVDDSISDTEGSGAEVGAEGTTGASMSESDPATTEATGGAESAESTGDATEGSASTEPSTTVYAGPVSPITGLPVDDPTLMNRKLLAVKVDNHWSAQPQSGIEKADGVFEVMVEGGLTRFLALFHHSDSEWVGPMRSARPTDWTLVRPLNGVLVISGGQRWITRQITDNDVPLVGDIGPPLTARWGERAAPHNLYVDTYEGRRTAADRGLGRQPPPPLFDRGPFSGPEEAPATYVFFDWSDTVDVSWQWDGDRYLRSADGEAQQWRTREGDETGQISADALIVLMAERYTACPQGEGSCVPAWDTVGENRAIVFADGRYQEGRWRRDTAFDWFRITDPRGQDVTIPPGKLWIMIYPETAGLVW